MTDDAKDSPMEPTNGTGPTPDAEPSRVARPRGPRPRTSPSRRRTPGRPGRDAGSPPVTSAAIDPASDTSATADPAPDTSPAIEPAADTGAPTDPAPDSGAPTRDEMSIAFTPAQMAVGGAIVAGLIVVGVRLLLGRRRGRD